MVAIYVLASFNPHDYRPSWTGNHAYSTMTIRGIFDNRAAAETADKNWSKDYNSPIIEYWIENEDETNVFPTTFDLDFYGGRAFSLVHYYDDSGMYNLNEIVEEAYSAVYDPNSLLGVSDY